MNQTVRLFEHEQTQQKRLCGLVVEAFVVVEVVVEEVVVEVVVVVEVAVQSSIESLLLLYLLK